MSARTWFDRFGNCWRRSPIRVEGAAGLVRSHGLAHIRVRAGAAEPHPGDDPDLDMDRFCPHRPARTERVASGFVNEVRLAGRETGRSHVTDLLQASLERIRTTATGGPLERRFHPSTSPDVPAKALLLDILVHERLWGGVAPTVIVRRTRHLGAPSGEGPDTACAIGEPLALETAPRESPRPTWPEWPQQSALMDAMSRRLGEDGGRFVHHRLRFPYPIPGFLFEASMATRAGTRG